MSEIVRIEQEMQALTIKDKLNVPYLLARQIITFQQAILNPHSEKDIVEAINGLVEMLPDAWKDNEWNKEIEEAKVTYQIDRRPLVAGRIRMTPAACKEIGIEPFEAREETDANKLFHACINLLYRRGLLSQVNRIEKVLGEEWDGKEK